MLDTNYALQASSQTLIVSSLLIIVHSKGVEEHAQTLRRYFLVLGSVD